jgi:hypothetical protein
VSKTVNESVGRKLLLLLGLYLLLTSVSAISFHWVRYSLTGPPRVLFALAGPALSLFTHMSYILFLLQSLLLIPWLVVMALVKRSRVICGVCFGVTWLAIGWHMYEVF